MRAVEAVDLTDYSPFSAPPMTTAKADMIEAGASEIDRLMVEVMAGYADTLICREQVILRFEDMLTDHDLDLPDDWRRVVERIFVRSTRKFVGQDRVRIDGKQRIVRMAGRAGTFASPDELIQEVLRNGPVTRQVRTSGSLVQFPQRR